MLHKGHLQQQHAHQQQREPLNNDTRDAHFIVSSYMSGVHIYLYRQFFGLPVMLGNSAAIKKAQ